MKNRIKAILGLIVFLIVMIVAVVLLFNKKEKEPIYIYEEEQHALTGFRICYGTLISVYDNEGVTCADFNDDFLDVISYECSEKSIVNIEVENDDIVRQGQKIFEIDGKPVLSPGDGRVIDIDKTNNNISITVLRYDKVSVRVLVPMDVFSQLNKNTEVKINCMNKEYAGYIDVKGYESVEGMIEIYVKAKDWDVIPGVDATVTFVLGETEPMVYVHEAAIEQLDGLNYIYVAKPELKGELPKTEEDLAIEMVAIGRVVTVIEGDNHFNYIELLGKTPESAGEYIWR